MHKFQVAVHIIDQILGDSGLNYLGNFSTLHELNLELLYLSNECHYRRYFVISVLIEIISGPYRTLNQIAAAFQFRDSLDERQKIIHHEFGKTRDAHISMTKMRVLYDTILTIIFSGFHDL